MGWRNQKAKSAKVTTPCVRKRAGNRADSSLRPKVAEPAQAIPGGGRIVHNIADHDRRRLEFSGNAITGRGCLNPSEFF